MLDTDGFLLLKDALPNDLVHQLRDLTEGMEIDSGLRGATSILIAAQQPMLEIARAHLGATAHEVRSILFDKTPQSNWLVPWHQDITIAVEQRHDLPGWGPWSLKNELPHVQPPASILESMLTLRLHLDETTAANGALKVIPCSHRHGILSFNKVQELRGTTAEEVCEASTGDILLMRPLLLHASSKSQTPSRRRILHIEYAAVELPDPLRWNKS